MGRMSERRQATGARSDGRDDQLTVWLLRALLYRNHWVTLTGGRGWGHEELFEVVGIDPDALDVRSPDDLKEQALGRLSDVERAGACRDHDLFRNVTRLGDLLDLGPCEREIMAFAVLVQADEHLNACATSLLKRCRGAAHAAVQALAHVLGAPPRDLRRALLPSGPLHRSGLIRFQPSDAGRGHDCLDVAEEAVTALLTPADSTRTLMERLIHPVGPPELTLDDFKHVSDDVDLLRAYLKGAVQARMRGVNILLHGPPGTGKTQLARLLGGEVATQVLGVGVDSPEGEILSRYDRLRSYQLTQALFERRGGSLLIFDELEDAFPTPMPGAFGGHHNRFFDKGWANQALETNPVPTVWISNHIDQLDPALVRRFDLVIELRRPPREVRKRVLRRHLPELTADPEWLDRVAADERLTPADVARASRVVRTLGLHDRPESRRQVERILDLNLTARAGASPAKYRHDAGRYDLSLLNTSAPLDDLVASLARGRAGAVCLYGPPGTGKTAFVHHVAERLGRPVMHKLASDLLSCWVGQTEQALAAMFRDAHDEGGILFLDEADSFLADRSGARQSWEVTQVNELLVQMERFEGLFFCSTNLVEHLDPAVFRRFALKVRFDPLTPDQRWAMAQSLLSEMRRRPRGAALQALRRRVRELEGLTAGDVAAARRRFEVLGARPTAEEIVGALGSELQDSGRGASPRPTGFRAPTARTQPPDDGSPR